MNNYRNNMPHYDSMPHHYNPMGINDFKTSNNKMRFTNTMPGIPENIFQRPFIPETEIPLEIDGDMPALPRMPETQMPGVTQPGMPGMPQQGMPGLIPPWMPQMPGIPQNGMPQPGMPMMPGMPQPGMPMMPGMPNGMPMMPGMPQLGMPMMPGMPNGMPMMPGMPNGMPPGDGNMYPMMPEMPNRIPPVTCEQLRELMRRMNCPINSNDDANGPRPIVPPENGTVPPMDEDI